jgi:MarR family transcriptional regulator, lower aerobic nicotinate degradation pathway regulator
MRVRSESVLEPFGLRPRHLVALTVLRDHPSSSQQSLSALLQIDRTNLVGLLNELECIGLVQRTRFPDDRRRHTVELTPSGADKLAQAECALAAAENEVLATLDEAQRETLFQLRYLANNGEQPDCSAAAVSD